MSFFSDPIGNISGAIHTVGKDISNATKNPLVDMAAAAALDYFTGGAGELVGSGGLFDAGLGAAGNAALVTGGIAGLASGNLAQGLMAGLAGYGGASLGEGLGMGNYSTNALNSANTANELSAGYQGTGNPMGGPTPAQPVNAPANVAGDLSPNAAPQISPNASSGTGLKMPTGYTAPTTTLPSLSTEVPKQSPFSQLTSWFGKQDLPTQLALGAAGVYGLKSLATPQKLNVPNTPDTRFIRFSSYSPMGGYTHQGMAPATQVATGGLVALAKGGGIHHYDDGGTTDSSAASSAAPDQALADYQAGNYAAAAQDITNSGMSSQDVVNKYGLSEDQAAQVAQNLGYAGNVSGLNYGSPAASAGSPAAAGPAYTNYTADQYSTFFNDPNNAAVLNTPGGLAAAEAQYHADPNAVSSYLQQNAAPLNLSAADLYQIGQGQGIQGVYNAIDSYAATHPNASASDIKSAMLASGISLNDVDKFFNQPDSAYGKNLATGQAFTGAGDIYAVNQGKGLSSITNSITNYIQTHPNATLTQAQAAMSASGLNEEDVIRATGKTSAQIYSDAKTQIPLTKTGTIQTGYGGNSTAPVPGDQGNVTNTRLPTNPGTNAPAGTSNPYGNVNNPGDITFNADGSRTITPNVPGRPYGGFSGMDEVTNAYTAGGGSTGYVNPVYQNMDQFNAANNTLTGGSKAAYDYLMGKTPWNPLPTTPTGQVSVPYQQLMGQSLSPQYLVNTPQIYDPATHTYKTNPNYDPAFSATKDYLGVPQTGLTNPNALKVLGYTEFAKGLMGYPNGDGTFTGVDGKKYNADGTLYGTMQGDGPIAQTVNKVAQAAHGGLLGLAAGGMSVGHLGGYSDGGRLLRGPGDGVSDSIPATIGSTDPEPARLADGEFVVPARIVSELGNGSTEAGARQLYKMMDRIQNARRKTTGKDAVATNTNAAKYLPV